MGVRRLWIGGSLLFMVAAAILLNTSRRRWFVDTVGSQVGTLKSLSTSQAQFQQEALVDQDGDGAGEYGLFQELCGTVPCRQSGIVADPTFMSASFGTTAAGAGGVASKSGYAFLIYLPDAAGAPHPEKNVLARGAVAADADAQERIWVAYAWPAHPDAGTYAYVVNQEGRIFRSEDPWPSTRGPSGDAAFAPPGRIAGPITGARWSLVGE